MKVRPLTTNEASTTVDPTDIWDKHNFAILMSYFSVGITDSLLSTPLNVYLVSVLDAEPGVQKVPLLSFLLCSPLLSFAIVHSPLHPFALLCPSALLSFAPFAFRSFCFLTPFSSSLFSFSFSHRFDVLCSLLSVPCFLLSYPLAHRCSFALFRSLSPSFALFRPLSLYYFLLLCSSFAIFLSFTFFCTLLLGSLLLCSALALLFCSSLLLFCYPSSLFRSLMSSLAFFLSIALLFFAVL